MPVLGERPLRTVPPQSMRASTFARPGLMLVSRLAGAAFPLPETYCCLGSECSESATGRYLPPQIGALAENPA
jgi:hypothetical protein